jgi:hypothetical protein
MWQVVTQSLLVKELLATVINVLPIVVIIIGFQIFVLRRRIPNLKRVIIGFIYVLVGLVCFLVGLDKALFPLGELMAKQLTDAQFVFGAAYNSATLWHWYDYTWLYIFSAALVFATTIAEPALMAVAMKAADLSGGAIRPTALRVAVAIGASLGVTLGTVRIVTGIPIHYFILTGYCVVLIQTLFAPRAIIPLAYDTGGVTTSTVTVPVVTALGIGLAGAIPGRSPLIDGFGLISFCVLFPMMTVMGYAQLSHWRARRKTKQSGSLISGG